VIRARVKPGKDDVTIPQLWERIDAQATRIDTLEEKLDGVLGSNNTLRDAARTMGEGFDALLSYVERTNHEPAFNPQEQKAIHLAKEVRADDSIWNTRQHPLRS